MDTYYHLDNNYISAPIKYGDVKLLQLGRMFCRAGMRCAEHVHLNWYELTIVTDGEGSIGTNGCDVPVRAGDIYVSFPADVHSISSSGSDPLKYDFISFCPENDELLSHLEQIHAGSIDPFARIFSDERIKRLVSYALKEFADKERPYRDKLISSLLTEIIIYTIRGMSERRTSSQTLNTDSRDILCYQIMSYIDTHIFSLKNLSELASAMNYNYSYLSYMYRTTTGQTLSDYFRTAKLRAAKLLIDEGKLKVSEIAELLNYSSIYVFSRAYKKKYGHPPSGEASE